MELPVDIDADIDIASVYYYYYYYYYAAFNAPCVGHKDDESQAQV